MDSAIYELSLNCFAGYSAWPRVVLAMERTPYARGASVSVLGALAFLVYPLGSDAVLTRCTIVSARVEDLMEGRGGER